MGSETDEFTQVVYAENSGLQTQNEPRMSTYRGIQLTDGIPNLDRKPANAPG
jgi:hypothetical protein